MCAGYIVMSYPQVGKAPVAAGKTWRAQDIGPPLGRPGRLRPALALGLVVAAALIVAETVLGYLLSRVAPEDTLGVVYLLGVVVIATGWGFWLAAATAVTGALAFDFFLIEPIGSLTSNQSGR